MTYTVDSSVWIAALLKGESAHRTSFAFMSGIVREDTNVVIPVTVYIEVVLAIARRTVNQRTHEEAADFFLRIPSIQFVEIDYARMLSIVEFASPLRLRGMDATIAGVANEFDATLVTLDDELARRTQSAIAVRQLS